MGVRWRAIQRCLWGEKGLFLLVFAVLALTVLPFSSPNERSRFALTRAIVVDHSFTINGYQNFVGIDVSRFGGNVYSTMAPGLSVLLILPFVLGTLLGPLIDPVLNTFGVGVYASPGQVILIQLFSAVCTAIATVYVYRLCIALGSGRTPAGAVSLIYTFATPTWVYGKTTFAHTYSALFLVMAYYYAVRTRDSSSRDTILAGVFYGVALSVEYTNLILAIPGILFLLAKNRKSLRRIGALLVPLAASGLLLLSYNAVCFGNILTFPESYWIGYRGQVSYTLGRFSTPLIVGLQGLLISSSRGLLTFSPVLILAVPGFYLLARGRGWKTKSGMRVEALVLGSVFMANLILYAKWDTWSGGGSYGPRFLVSSLPFLVTPLFTLIEWVFSKRSMAIRLVGGVGLSALYVASTSITSIGAITSPVAGYSKAPFLTFLAKSTGYPSILSGRLRDVGYTVLINRAGSVSSATGPVAGQVFWILVVAVPILAFLLILKKVSRAYSPAARVETALQPVSTPMQLPEEGPASQKAMGIRRLLGNRKLDVAALILFVVLAFAIRIWSYTTIPTPRNDELGEEKIALRILSGGYYPLTNYATFMGSFFQYVLVMFFLVFGDATSTARLMSVFFGSFTVGLTYLLAKDLYDRKTAIIASVLLATSVAHVLIASHVGWSASLTPFMGVLTVYLFNKAFRSRRRLLYFATGVAAGITLQTHPSSIFLLAGLGMFLMLWHNQASLWRRHGFLLLLYAMGGFVVGYANMIYYNVVSRLGSVAFAQRASWTGISSLGWSSYSTRLRGLSSEYLRLLGDYMIETLNFGVLLSQYKVVLFLFLVAIGVAYALKKHGSADRMLLIILGLAWLILPIGIKGFGYPSPWGGHYVMLLLPLSYMIIAAPLGALLNSHRIGRRTRLVISALIALILVYSVVTSLLSLKAVYGTLGQ
jgi:4-amino-4-deoxy-L-arabinose transferase-like glycosyltransferase